MAVFSIKSLIWWLLWKGDLSPYWRVRVYVTLISSFKLGAVLSLVMTVCIRKRVDVYIDIQIGLYVCRLQIAGTVLFYFWSKIYLFLCFDTGNVNRCSSSSLSGKIWPFQERLSSQYTLILKRGSSGMLESWYSWDLTKSFVCPYFYLVPSFGMSLLFPDHGHEE